MGKSFSPAAFAKVSSVKLANAHEAGAIGLAGIYRGKPIPYGSASIQVSDKAEQNWANFDALLSLIESCIDTLREAGAEDITLSCSLFHDGQCNFGFSKEQLKRIAALKVDLPISCYSTDVE